MLSRRRSPHYDGERTRPHSMLGPVLPKDAPPGPVDGRVGLPRALARDPGESTPDVAENPTTRASGVRRREVGRPQARVAKASQDRFALGRFLKEDST